MHTYTDIVHAMWLNEPNTQRIEWYKEKEQETEKKAKEKKTSRREGETSLCVNFVYMIDRRRKHFIDIMYIHRNIVCVVYESHYCHSLAWNHFELSKTKSQNEFKKKRHTKRKTNGKCGAVFTFHSFHTSIQFFVVSFLFLSATRCYFVWSHIMHVKHRPYIHWHVLRSVHTHNIQTHTEEPPARMQSNWNKL